MLEGKALATCIKRRLVVVLVLVAFNCLKYVDFLRFPLLNSFMNCWLTKIYWRGIYFWNNTSFILTEIYLTVSPFKEERNTGPPEHTVIHILGWIVQLSSHMVSTCFLIQSLIWFWGSLSAVTQCQGWIEPFVIPPSPQPEWGLQEWVGRGNCSLEEEMPSPWCIPGAVELGAKRAGLTAMVTTRLSCLAQPKWKGKPAGMYRRRRSKLEKER